MNVLEENLATNIVQISIESQVTLLSLKNNSINIPIGFDLIKDKFLKSTPPTPNEIEYAINYIEDEIEKIVKKLPINFILYFDSNSIKEITLLLKKENEKIKTDDLEYLFGQYAEVSQGRVSQSFQTDITPLFYSKLLIIRELTHHLKLESFKLINS